MDSLFNLSKWQSVKLSDISITKSGVLSSTNVLISKEGSIPFIEAKHILSNKMYGGNLYIAERITNPSGVEIIPKYTLLIAVSGPTVGNIAILETDAIVDNKILYLIVDHHKINHEYLYYYLCFSRNQIVKSSKYLDRVSYNSLSKLNVPVPPIEFQEIIIAELEKQLRYSTILTNRAEKKIADLNNEKQNILHLENNSLFKTFEVIKIKDCGQIKAGKTPTGSVKQYFGHKFPFYNPDALEQGMNIINCKMHLSDRGFQEARAFETNSILICCQGQLFGKAGICRTTGACNSQMISITPSEKVIPEYLYFQIISDTFQKQMKNNARNLSISKSDFEELYITLPPLKIQKNIIDALLEQLSALHLKEIELIGQLQKAELIKKNAFLKAFGEIK